MIKHVIKILMGVAVFISALILVAVGYVIYVAASYSTMEDHLPLAVKNNTVETLIIGEEYRIITYNIGYGAYSPQYSFFMDKGRMKNGKKVRGKYGKGISKSDVLHNANGALSILNNLDYDFVFAQEVDEDGNRSYHIDQVELIRKNMPQYANIYAKNFHSSYLYYPLGDPYGKNDSGLLTLSRYRIDSAVRRSLPASNDVTKYFDLDACFCVSRLSVADKELVLVNLQLSAFDKNASVRKRQLALLKEFLKSESEKGNYVIAGGDFNGDICSSADKFQTQQAIPDRLWSVDELSFVEAKNKYDVPTFRSGDMPYEKDVSFAFVSDGFIVSDNILVTETINLDTQFMFSDHNPVIMNFILKE